MQKSKSTNLHEFQHELFLGFLAQQPLKQREYEVSFIGGQPLWLNQPKQQLLICQNCSSENNEEILTFLGQVFCPLNAEHCYNRVMYFLYCEKCRRTFKCIKQQTGQNWEPKEIILSKKIKTISIESFQIESDPLERKQLTKIMNRSKIQVQQQIVLQQEAEDDQSQQGEQVVINVQKFTVEQMKMKMQEGKQAKKNRQYTEKEIQEINKRFESLKLEQDKELSEKHVQEKEIHKTKTDHVFEQYKRTITTLNNPVLIYSNIPVSYNSRFPLNPKHECQYCHCKLQLEIQLTEKILLLNKNLALLDWGSIFVYACVGSCNQSEEQEVVVQYEVDAISEEEIAKLKKVNKTRKKNKNKSLSKEKKKIEKQNIQPELVKNEKNEKNQSQQGDWD